MTAAEPAGPGEFAADALTGAVVSGILIPVLQFFLLSFFDAFPESTVDTSATAMLVIVLVGMKLLPLVSTLASMAAAYGIGGPVGVGLYVIMSVAASALLDNPVMGFTVLIVAMFAMTIWLLVQARQQSTARRGGFR